jgi:predicted nucleic acid-binding protein
MQKENDSPRILLDCDVIIHFAKAGRQLLLPKIFPNRFVILDKVLSELEKRKSNIQQLNNFIEWTKIEVISMPRETAIIREYAVLKKTMGDGEAACLAVARHSKDYIASSNLKDIKAYCEAHQIVYLTTMDVLLEAYNQDIMSEAECDLFIYEVKSKDSKLINSINTIKQYQAMKNNRTA